ncbi:MAG: hypothetical protein H0V84_09105 [Actinobacteria bacterium]|nr:hypothetical protein [Actinomycetota bacterium]
MFRSALITVVLALATAATALAVGEPAVLASAQIGRLHVVSSVQASPKGVDLLGVWVDESFPCTQTRLLDVKGSVDYVPFGQSGQRVTRKKTMRVANCAEGGPNTGFTLTAKGIGYGCPNGRWKPGQYTFVTVSVDHRKRLKAVASVGWENRTPC